MFRKLERQFKYFKIIKFKNVLGFLFRKLQVTLNVLKL